jgi:hypothetical protein
MKSSSDKDKNHSYNAVQRIVGFIITLASYNVRRPAAGPRRIMMHGNVLQQEANNNNNKST